MSKLSFRARALDASKPLPIYMSEELPDLPEYSAINRAVPQMPTGMEKEEESEHHLQRAIVTGLIIPTPEVTKIEETCAYDRLYPPNYKPPRQLIRMQPFAMEEDYPDYDIDSEDEKWITMQKLDISPRKFEEMMDRLEKNCAQNFATQDRKELLLKDDDELSIAIYDYWLSKRLKTPQALVPCVKTEVNNRLCGGGGGGGVGGANSNNNPYLAFRRRTEKMQTRKNRKNDEASYEKMIKLRRDLTRALSLLDLVKRRENTKRNLLSVTIQLYEKRYQAGDLSGALLAEVSALKCVRPAFTPLYTNQYTTNHSSWPTKPPKEDVGLARKEKRQYKKRKHKAQVVGGSGALSSGEDEGPVSPASPTHQLAYPFLRNKNCIYQAPLSGGKIGSWSPNDEKYRYCVTSVSQPWDRCIGLGRRRLGRGGRVILDRAGPSADDFWANLDYTIHDSWSNPTTSPGAHQPPLRHFRPKSPVVACTRGWSEGEEGGSGGEGLSVEVESICEEGGEVTSMEVDLAELFPDLDCVNRGGGGSLLERWVDSTPPRQSPSSLLDRLFNDLHSSTGGSSPAQAPSSVSTPTTSDYSKIGSSEFNVTDDGKDKRTKWRGACVRLCDRVPSSSAPAPPSVTPLSNGPISRHNDHDSSWFVTSSGVQMVYKRGGSAAPAVLNSKLPGRANSNQVNSEEVEGDKRRGVSVMHSHAMEVT